MADKHGVTSPKSGFVYIWFDTYRKKFYLGSHIGHLDDGYVGSNERLLRAYKKRPHTFKRRILEYYPGLTEDVSIKALREREQLWLDLIKDEELHGVKYYNSKKVAAGGDIYSTLTEDGKIQHRKRASKSSRKFWDNISEEEYEKRRKTCFGGNLFSREYLKQRNKLLCSKKAIVTHPNGHIETILNVAEFCRFYNLNYGNFKTILRKGGTCKGFTGSYIDGR